MTTTSLWHSGIVLTRSSQWIEDDLLSLQFSKLWGDQWSQDDTRSVYFRCGQECLIGWVGGCRPSPGYKLVLFSRILPCPPLPFGAGQWGQVGCILCMLSAIIVTWSPASEFAQIGPPHIATGLLRLLVNFVLKWCSAQWDKEPVCLLCLSMSTKTGTIIFSRTFRNGFRTLP